MTVDCVLAQMCLAVCQTRYQLHRAYTVSPASIEKNEICRKSLSKSISGPGICIKKVHMKRQKFGSELHTVVFGSAVAKSYN